LRGFAPKLTTRLGRAAMSRFATFVQERRYLKNVSPFHSFLSRARLQMAAFNWQRQTLYRLSCGGPRIGNRRRDASSRLVGNSCKSRCREMS